jgi:hypothetical protein
LHAKISPKHENSKKEKLFSPPASKTTMPEFTEKKTQFLITRLSITLSFHPDTTWNFDGFRFAA